MKKPATTTVMQCFADRMGIKLAYARELERLVGLAAYAQEKHADGIADNACSRVDAYAYTLGLGTDWRPGIYPLITKGELREHLPD